MKKAYPLLTIFTLCWTLALGQQIQGRVTDIHNVPLQGATINIYRQDSGTPIESVSSDSTGRYIFEKLTVGIYYQVKSTMVGFEAWAKDSILIKQPTSLELHIAMEPSSSNLAEVTVTAERAYIEKRHDRTVVNPDIMLSSTGGTALEALEKSPGVLLDQSGNIRLSGKSGVSVYIDDRPTNLVGEQLREFLRTVPVAQIDRIELMTNPPANYDAAGSGGIIAIHTKRYRSKGIHGGVSLAYQQGKYGQTNNSADIAFNNFKWALSATTSFSTTDTYTDLDILRKFEGGQSLMSPIFSQDTWIRRKGTSLSGRLGADYFMDEKSTIGVNLNLRSSPLELKSLGESRFISSPENPDSILIANNIEERTFSNLGANLNYRYKKPESGQKLTIDLDFLNYRGNNEQLFDNSTYLPGGEATAFESQLGRVPNDIKIYSAKADFVHPFKETIRISSGLKTSSTFTDNDADFYRIFEDDMVVDLEKTNHFRFRESIHSAFTSIDGKYGKWSYQAGLRFEGTISSGHQLGNGMQPDSSFNRRHFDFFPTVYLQYRPSAESKHAISLNYGRRIDRPHYAWLNPFVTPFDKYTYYVGTPYLRPSFVNQTELSYNFQPLVDFTLAYAKVKDLMSETIRIEDGIYYSQQGNLGSLKTLSATLNVTYSPIEKVTLIGHTAIHHIHTKSAIFGQQLDTKGTFMLIRPALTYKPSEKWTFQVDGEYQGGQKFAQFSMKDRTRVNSAINFKMNAGCSFNLAINDIFHSDINAGEIGYLSGTYATFSTLRDSRTVNLSFRYRFTKGAKNDRQYQGGGAQSEQQRT